MRSRPGSRPAGPLAILVPEDPRAGRLTGSGVAPANWASVRLNACYGTNSLIAIAAVRARLKPTIP